MQIKLLADPEHEFSSPHWSIAVLLLMQFAKNNEYYLKALKNTHVLNKEGYQADIYLLKVNNRNTRTRCEICSKLTIKIPERRQCRRCGIVIANFEHISHLVLEFL